MLYTKEERNELRKTEAFAKSNKVWNDFEFNSKSSLGNLMYLISSSNAKTQEDWAKYYFATGRNRERIINKGAFSSEIDHNHGRTNQDLLLIAKKLQQKLKCTFELAYNYVYIRVIDETWIGYRREVIALKRMRELIKLYKNIHIEDAAYEIDSKYAVDFEVLDGEILLFAIQLKSENYKRSKNPGTLEAKKFNKRKNKKYTNKFGVPVLYIYINDKKEITNLDDFKNSLDTYMLKKTL